MRIAELIKDLTEVLDRYGDQEVYILDDRGHYPIRWTMVLLEAYARVPAAYYIRIGNRDSKNREE